MLSFFKKYKFFGISLLIISIIIISIFYSILKPKKVLPIYQPTQVSTELVDSTIQHKKKYHKIADFSLINQNGETITQENYKDKIYVADFFFTTCKTICPIMTKNMHIIQKEIITDNDVMLLSHSVTPEIDTVAQLKRYAKEKHVKIMLWAIWNTFEKQKKEASEILNEFNKKLDGKIQTNISKIKNYCKAEEYHQKYIEKNK